MKTKLFVILMGFFCSLLFGQQAYTFTGAGDGSSWNDPGNWTTHSVPLTDVTRTADVTIPTGFTVIIGENQGLYFGSGTINGGGEVVNKGSFSIEGNSSTYLAGDLKFYNQGTFNIGDGTSNGWNFYLKENAVLTNEETGLLISQGKSLTNSSSEEGKLINHGTLVKKGAYARNIDPPFLNTGTIRVEEGQLVLPNRNELEGGTYEVWIGTQLNLSNSGTQKLSGTLSGNIAGSFYLAGNITIEEGKTLVNNLGGNGLYFSSGTIMGDGTFRNQSTLSIFSNSNTYLASNLKFQNYGIFNLGNGANNGWYLYLQDNAIFTNEAGGIFYSQGKSFNYSNLGDGEFINRGTLIKKGAYANAIDPPFTNYGTIHVEEGVLQLNHNNKLDGGTYNIGPDAELSLSSAGTHILNGNLIGNVEGAFNMRGNLSIENGKTATNNTSGNGLSLLNATMAGAGTFVNQTVFSVLSSASVYFGETLKFENNGTFNLGDGGNNGWNFYIKEDAVLTNNEDGLFISQGKDFAHTQLGSGEFINHGTLIKKGAYAKAINPPFTNDGTINVESGTLQLNENNRLDGGTYNINTDAELSLSSAGTHILNGNLAGNVEGVFTLRGNLAVESGHTATNATTGNGMYFISGSLKGDGSFINQTKFSVLQSSNTYFGENIQFNNEGTFNLGDGINNGWNFFLSDNALFTNLEGAEVFISGKSIANGGLQDGQMINEGKIIKKGNYEKIVDVPLVNHGTIEAEEGTLYLSNQFTNETEGLIKGYSLKFKDADNLNNKGITNPGMSPGKMTVGQFFSLDDGVLEFELNGLTPETEYDVLEFTAATSIHLAGTIRPVLGFAPEVGHSFTVFKHVHSFSTNQISTSLPAEVEANYQDMIYVFDVVTHPKEILLVVKEFHPDSCAAATVSDYFISHVRADFADSSFIERNSGFETDMAPADVTTPGYGDYRNDPAYVLRVDKAVGTVFTFEIDGDNDHPDLDYHYEVWVDRNLDGLFANDEHQELLVSETVKGGQLTGTFDLRLNEYADGCDAPNGTYPLRIVMTVTNPACEVLYGETEDYMLEITGDCDGGLSVESSKFESFSYYPNPVVSQLTLKAGSPINRVEVYNLSGQKVRELAPKTMEVQINMERLTPGLYLMRADIGGEQKTFKIIKK